jgi:hypothetical protein
MRLQKLAHRYQEFAAVATLNAETGFVDFKE